MSARGGIDLGGTKIQAVVVNGRNSVIGESRHPTPTSGGPPAVAAEMATALGEAAEAAGVEPSSLASVGVGFPKGAAGHAFAPAGGEVVDLLELLSWELALRHHQP